MEEEEVEKDEDGAEEEMEGGEEIKCCWPRRRCAVFRPWGRTEVMKMMIDPSVT